MKRCRIELTVEAQVPPDPVEARGVALELAEKLDQDQLRVLVLWAASLLEVVEDHHPNQMVYPALHFPWEVGKNP